MSNWIYIKSNRLIDAFAVASLISENQEMSVVRKRRFAPLFRSCLSNNHYDYYSNNSEDKLVIIEQNEAQTIQNAISLIAKKLEIETREPISCSQIHMPNVDTHLDFCLMLSHDDHIIDLQLIDFAINSLVKQGLIGACIGDTPVPCIRGCRDYRCILKWEHIPMLASKKMTIITNSDDYAQVAISYGASVVHISSIEGRTSANGYVVEYPDILSNIILKSIK